MGTLKDTLLEKLDRAVVLDDCVELVEGEVSASKGASGLVIKGGYKAFKKLKPGIVRDAMDALLEPLVDILDRHYTDFEADKAAQAQGLVAWITQRKEAVAEDILGLGDAAVELSDKKVVKKTYKAVRKVGRKNVVAAVPAIGEMMQKYSS